MCLLSTPDDVRITKTQRWLDLIAFLVKRRLPVAADEIMEAVPSYARKWRDGSDTDRATVQRMFERDKDELRDLGVPIRSVDYTIDFGAEEITGYRLATRDFYLPYLRVLREGREEAASSDAGAASGPAGPAGPAAPPAGRGAGAGSIEIPEDQARAAVEALSRVASLPNSPFADASRTALRKLAFDLDVDALATAPVLFVPPFEPPDGEDPRGRIRGLLGAVRARKEVSFRYHGIQRGTVTERTVAPYGLLFHHGHWYLIGHDRLRDDLRVFRLGRMEDVEINDRAPKTPDYEIPDTFDLSEFAGRRPWELGDDHDPVTAHVRIEFPLSLWADRNGYGRLVRALEGGAAIRAMDVHRTGAFLRWVLSQAGEASVVAPPELVEAYRELVAETAALYSDAGAGEGS